MGSPNSLLTTYNSRLKTFTARGTSGDLRHPRHTRYRCSLPGLAGFAGPRCTEPEVPRSGVRALPRVRVEKSSIAMRAQPECSGALNRVSVKIVSWSAYDFAFAAGASGGCTSDGFTQFTLKGPIA